jgi:hypothetical protein
VYDRRVSLENFYSLLTVRRLAIDARPGRELGPHAVLYVGRLVSRETVSGSRFDCLDYVSRKRKRLRFSRP